MNSPTFVNQGQELLFLNDDGSLYRWDLDTPAVLSKLPVIEDVGGIDSNQTYVDVASDGSFIAVLDSSYGRIIDVETGELRAEIRISLGESLDISPDDRIVVFTGWDSTTDIPAQILDTATGEVLYSFPPGIVGSYFTDVKFNDAGTLIVFTSDDGTLQVWGLPGALPEFE